MTIPEVKVTETINGRRFEWTDDKLVVSISRIRVHSDGKITGDIQLLLGKKKQEEPSFHFNFSSAQTRKQLINSLNEKYPEWQWLEIIDELCRRIQRLATEGESVIELSSSDTVSPLEYLVSPIIPTGKPTAIFGDPGTGKSQVLLILAMVAALPWHDNPLRLGAPAKSTPILYLDYEADPDDIRRSLHAFTEGMGLGHVPIFYRRCSLPIADDLEAIRNHADSVKAQAIFVDSTSLAAGGDLNRMDIATSYIRALRQLKLTSVSLTHTSKDRDAKTKTIIGSVLFEAGFRSVFEARAHEEGDTLEIALFHRKFNLGAKASALGYRINYNCNGNTIEWYDPKNVPEFVERMGTNQRILQALKKGKLSTGELVELLEIKRASIDVAVGRLSKANKIIGDSKGWGLPADENI